MPDAIKGRIPPWRVSLCGLASFYEMQQFFGDFFSEKLVKIGASEAKLCREEADTVLDPKISLQLYAELGVFAGLCEMHSLNSPAQQAKRIMETLEKKGMRISCGEMRIELRNLRQRCEDDFKSAFFLHLEPTQAEMYQNPRKDWEPIVSRFFKMKYNVEESARCFALERYGAAVFHILQVAEYGVIQIADLMEVSQHKPGWGQLKPLQQLIAVEYPKRSDLAKKHSKFLEDTLHLAVIIRDNWRHKLDHVDKQTLWIDTDFSPLVAQEIISATRAFMRKLASDLPRIRNDGKGKIRRNDEANS